MGNGYALRLAGAPIVVIDIGLQPASN